MNTDLIITHPGRAHTDEFLACCVLLAELDPEYAVEIHRRNPCPIEDVDAYWVDVGKIYDTWELRFDHHQNPLLPCSLVLVLQYLSEMTETELNDLLPWLKAVNEMDCKGPKSQAEKYNLTVPQFFSLQVNPVGQTLVDLFGDQTVVERDSSLGNIMTRIGESILKQIETVAERRKELQERCARLTLPVGDKVYQIVVLPPKEGEKNPQDQLSWWQRNFAPDAVVSVSANPRGGFMLYRIDDAPGVDCHRLEGKPGVSFVHANGFLAVVDTWERAMEYLPLVFV